MKTSKAKTKTRNELWLARKHIGLGQKQVSYLMGHKTTDQVCRYEKGSRIPGLRILLQLELIYGKPLKYLYPEQYEQVRSQIRERSHDRPLLTPKCQWLIADERIDEMFCEYVELLGKPSLSEPEKNTLRKHVIAIMRRIAEL